MKNEGVKEVNEE